MAAPLRDSLVTKWITISIDHHAFAGILNGLQAATIPGPNLIHRLYATLDAKILGSNATTIALSPFPLQHLAIRTLVEDAAHAFSIFDSPRHSVMCEKAAVGAMDRPPFNHATANDHTSESLKDRKVRGSDRRYREPARVANSVGHSLSRGTP